MCLWFVIVERWDSKRRQGHGTFNSTETISNDRHRRHRLADERQ